MKNFYTTTSIAYVNGPPHIGFALELVLADVLKRYAQSLGDKAFLLTGTDEHGGKVAEKAQDSNFTPKEYADKMSILFSDLAKRLNISNDSFIRTTDKEHEKKAQQIWTQLENDIYKGKYVGWYCTGDEAFFTDEYVRANNGICPNHNRPFEKIEEENYFFRLSKYSNQIQKYIEDDTLRIIPITRKNEILAVIKGGLDDISVSRPKEKISWGVNVPGDDSQVIYVWFEALLNYITALNYPDGQDFKDFWPANYHVIGKDILRFHAAIWPAILLGLDLALPKSIYVHGFININNKKISKSLNNSIDPNEIIDKYGVDPLRYYLLRHVPSHDDGDFSWQKLHDAYQNELGNELGNAVQRTAVMANNYFDGQVNTSGKTKKDSDLIGEFMKNCQFDRALDKIWEKVRELNQYIDDEKPWVLHRQDDKEKLREVITNQVERLLSIADLLKPFLPDTSEKIVKIFRSEEIQIPKETLFPRIEEPTEK